MTPSVVGGGVGPRARSLVLPIGLFVVFWAAYLVIGLVILSTRALDADNLMFEADTVEVVRELTGWSSRYSDYKHPLFPLLLNPLGRALHALTGRGVLAVVLLTSSFGASVVAIGYSIYRRIGCAPRCALLLSAILGVSTSQVFFSSVPERHAFAAWSLALLCLLAVQRPGQRLSFVPAAVLAFGITLTNAIQATILFVFTLYQRHLRLDRRFVRSFLAFAASSLGLALVLTIVQGLAYPKAPVFFVPESYRPAFHFLVRFEDPLGLLSRLRELAGQMFLGSFLAPSLEVDTATSPPSVSFSSLGGGGIYALGVALWSLLLLQASWGFARSAGDQKLLMWGLLTCLLFNLVLHTFWGDAFFLYSCNWTVPAAVLIGLSMRWFDESRSRWVPVRDAILGTFLAIQCVNNMLFVRSLVTIMG